MTDYPKTIPDLLTATAAWVVPAAFDQAFVDAYDAAIAHRSPVAAIVSVFDLMKDREDLDSDGTAILKGCAFLIAENGFHGRAGDAVALLMA